MKAAPAQQSLAARLLLFAFGSTLIGALVISWVAIDSTRRSVQDIVDGSHPAALEGAAHVAGEWLAEGREAAERVASRIAPDTPNAELTSLARGDAALAALAWIERDGRVLRASDALPGRLSGTTLRGLAIQTTPAVVPLALEDESSTFAAWLPAPDGGLLAVFARERLTEHLAGLLPDRASVLSLIDAGGSPLVSVEGGDLGTPAQVDLDTLRRQPGALHEYTVADQILIGAALPLEVPGFHLALQTPFAAAHAPIHSLVTRVLAVAAAVTLVVSLLAYGLTARALRPIEALSLAARNVADGATDVELPLVRSRDEVGVLTETLGEMLAQIRTHREQLEEANRDLKDRNARLEAANEVLGQLSITDGLTQLHNHRFFQDHLTREIKRVTRSGEALSMAVIDIDDFKKLNDRHGHAAGDEVLRRIAALLDESVRDSDLLARYGGEEFVILACGTDLQGAYVLAQKVRTAIAENSFIVDDSLRPVRITVSIGVAQYSGNRKRFFADADDALYRAKAAGKNCVVIAD